MELTIEQALRQGVAAYKEGKLQDAERLYRAILQSQPAHPEANHNLGVLAVFVDKADAALPLFKNALEANPKIEQFWLSYIEALIKEQQFENAKQVFEQAKTQGMAGAKLNSLKAQLTPEIQTANTHGTSPSQELKNLLLNHYQNGQYHDAEKLAESITEEFPEHQFAWKILGAVFGQSGRNAEAVTANQTAVSLSPQDAEAYSNLGITLQKLGRLDEAVASYTQAIALKPDYAEAHYNLGNTLKELGRLDEAEARFRHAIAWKPDYAKAHNNFGVTLQELGRLDEAEASYKLAIALKSDYAEAHNNLGVTLQQLGKLGEAEVRIRHAIALQADYAEAHYNLGITLQKLSRLNDAEASYMQAISLNPNATNAYWNLHGIQKNIQDAEHWIDKCLSADANHQSARLTKSALRFYQDDSKNFDELMQTEFKQHPYMRSFSWVFSLPNLPELHFNKFYFFDAIVKKCIISKPFYEFGVWRASSFKYLLKTFKKGYGFDTFTGLPEDWLVGNGIEKAGSYPSDGNVPKIRGGEFIVGKFEDTLPVFFSESRPTASLINFDADLYSSTICALNFSKPVIDKDTMLIFDEFIMHESWEQDEFRALNEFCSINNCSYEVIAISFVTKQVAIKLIGI
jgi:tetratricopeptide (TPR) repeat protein